MYVLEFYVKVEWFIFYEILVKFCEVVIVCFGIEVYIIIIVMIVLVKVCEKNYKYYYEVVMIYEEVIIWIKIIKIIIVIEMEMIVIIVKKCFLKVYVMIIIFGGVIIIIIFDRVIELCYEVYCYFKFMFGCWYQEILFKLKDVIVFYLRFGGEKLYGRILELF